MTGDELLLRHPGYRGLFVAGTDGEITFDEAVFLARRVEFELRWGGVQAWLNALALRVYDLLHQP